MGRLQDLFNFLKNQYNQSAIKERDLFNFVKSVRSDVKDLTDFEFLQYCEYIKEEIDLKHNSGQLIGVITAQSIGELNTQQSLDAKGKQDDKARKKPSNFRMIDKLINLSGWKFAPDIIFFNVDNPLKHYYDIKETKLSDILVKTEVTHLMPPWVSRAENFFNDYLDRNYQVLIYTIDKSMIDIRNIRMFEIVDKLQQTTEINNFKIFFDSISCQIVVGSYDLQSANDVFKEMCIKGIEDVKDIYIDKHYYTNGVTEIVKSDRVVCKFNPDGWFTKEQLKKNIESKYQSNTWKGDSLLYPKEPIVVQPFEYIFETTYSKEYKLKYRKKKLIEILKLDFVDQRRTYTDHIDMVFNTQGKEAAQAFFERELNVYTGNKLNKELIHIIGNTIFARDIMKISRAGYKSREGMGWISKISFEEKDNVLEECAFYGNTDDLSSALSSLAMSQKPKINYLFK